MVGKHSGSSDESGLSPSELQAKADDFDAAQKQIDEAAANKDLGTALGRLRDDQSRDKH